MKIRFRTNAVSLAICLAYPAVSMPALAAEPFPALPVTLSSSVTPNVILMIDTSGSMGDCPAAASGWGCTKKITSAKTVAKALIAANPTLRWGLFSFDGSTAEGAKLKANIGSTTTALNTAINNLSATGATPLGEALYEVGRYWAGEASAFSKITGNYTSPIQYRCQKNFNIFISDGMSTADDNNLPGSKDCTGYDWNGYCSSWAASANAKDSYGTWSSAGVATDLSFGICTNTTAVNANISCPSKLEGSINTADTFNDNYSPWVRSVRDVAAFLFDRDMKYKRAAADTDADGASWDNPKFPKQNVITYTVGFDIDNTPSATGSDGPTVLAATATVGGGKYYAASDEGTLSTALTNAVNSIIASTSNAGGLATTSPYKVAGNKLFQPVFNPDGWYGELRCYDYASVTYDAIGNILTGACSVPKAVLPAEASRQIYSSTWQAAAGQLSGTATSGTGAFAFTSTNATLGLMTTAQKNDLGSTDADRLKVITFLRGGTVTGYRSRTQLLGDIIDAQPVVVAAPSGSTSDTAYATFVTNNASRSMVFIGANDGMMHAFSVSDMTELAAYVPAAVYPHLDELTKTDYGVSTGTPHVYHANGEVRQADLKLNGSWKTVLVGGLGQGGQGFYALDATSASTLAASAASAVKWEWNDQHDNEMGYSFGAPLIYNVRTSATEVAPAVILVNGYENDYDDTAVGGQRKAENTTYCTRVVSGVTKACNTSALYVVNADTGKLIKKISIPGSSNGIGGLSSPAGVDYGQDGILDYVYAGDLSGRLWRFDLTSTNPANFTVASTPIFDAGTSQPITLRPVVKPVSTATGDSRGNLIMFGTGKLQTETDRATTTTQSFYAVLDDLSASPTTISKTSLLQRQVDTDEHLVSATSYRTGSYRKITPLVSTETFDLTLSSETRKGWYLDFPTSSERLVSSPVLQDYMVLFGTGIPVTTEKCVPGGKGWVMGLDPLTGGVTVSGTKKAYSFVDVYVDGKSTVADKVAFSSGDAYVSGFSVDGIPTELTYVSDQSKVVTIDSSSNSGYGSAGNVIALRDANIMSVFTGNAAAGVTKGDSMGKPAADGRYGGRVVVGAVGGPTVSDAGANGTPTDAYKVQTTIWREVK